MPVAVLTGARQTGKSTIAGMHASGREWGYATLDDPAVQGLARSDPDAFVSQTPRLVIDEVQREPDLLRAVKIAVDGDRPRRPGRFLLTGSANVLLMKRVQESLAGRASYVTLVPLTRREQLGLGEAGIWSDLLDASADVADVGLSEGTFGRRASWARTGRSSTSAGTSIGSWSTRATTSDACMSDTS